MDNIFKNTEEYNPLKKHEVLIYEDMTADMLSNKNLF